MCCGRKRAIYSILKTISTQQIWLNYLAYSYFLNALNPKCCIILIFYLHNVRINFHNDVDNCKHYLLR